MNTASITRLASAAVVTGIASVALAAPANAMLEPEPRFRGGDISTPTTTVVDAGWELAQVATGALGGLAVVGAGLAAAAGLHRRNQHVAHPA